jgi:hypothetical protein
MTNIYYIIYKIINQINGKIYIGKHTTSNLEDEYLGSGHYLNRAIKKYRKESFRKEILFVFDNEVDMNEKEKELVDLEFVLREDTYNLVLGGNGGQIVLKEGHPKYEETKSKIKKSRTGCRHWTNGIETVVRKECPGKGWKIGRAENQNFKWSTERKNQKKKEYNSGKMRWWNNGIKNLRAVDCPGVDWQRGRLKSTMSDQFLKNKEYNRKYDYIILKNLGTGDIIKLNNITGEFKEFCKLNKIHNIVTAKKSKNYLIEELIVNPSYNGRFKKE